MTPSVEDTKPPAPSTQKEDPTHNASITAITDPETAPGLFTVDSDALKLASMGYTQDMRRKYTVWSVLGVGFSITNSWFGISAALITGINSGGPLLVIYGILLIAVISTAVGVSLSELASAMPNAGGQYFWAGMLAPKGWRRGASYVTGWVAWWGAMFTSASVALAIGGALVGCWQLGHPEFTIKTWHAFLAYQLANLFCFLFNCYGKILPIIGSTTLWISLFSFLVILITAPAVAPTHQHARFVFATFINNTGWSENGIAFIVGLVNTNWAFACLDCATHLAEEIHRPEKMVPIAIMGTIGIGLVTSWFFSVAIFFSIVGDFSDISASSTGVPILEIFYRALRNNAAGAIALECLIIVTGMGCLVASHTWQSRLCWSFARDRGVPGHRWLAQVHPVLDVPLYAHAASCTVVAVMGCLYLASQTAFNSMITACIVLLYISYAIPVSCLLIRGRRNIEHGPFWLGPWGALANVVLLVWTLFTLIMYSFPYTKPVKPGNMNYVSVVYVVVASFSGAYWLISARKDYSMVEERHVEVLEGKGVDS
ncbi:hypothetical protein COCMIDRAFT_92457 [Bipolaris oryzae ATCC 44560]|uniref:Choline transport protein n=1 Tax=Bipolaris oryzae ATCC 44560 TaxID=930090 RepID=W6Z941_COCMI|nr:uncharacterized protein COCMIDRAFT_92457 [Bipolaris oryzae ATCC 44560]EUC46550.1 hypothetical protein COCMIDRAFT_92457 [Bipolaris oryzae ATCC 44560]